MAHAATLHDDVMSPPHDRATGAGVYNEKLGMWVFLGSEVMFFTALIGTYLILRNSIPTDPKGFLAWPKPEQVHLVEWIGAGALVGRCFSPRWTTGSVGSSSSPIAQVDDAVRGMPWPGGPATAVVVLMGLLSSCDRTSRRSTCSAR